MSPVHNMPRRFHAPDGAQQHREWLSLVEITGPFLSLPVLRDVWPDLDAVDRTTREQLRREHVAWQTDPGDPDVRNQWIGWVLRDLLGWAELLRADGLDPLAVEVAEHDVTLTPTHVLVEPGTGTDAYGSDVEPGSARLLVSACSPGQSPNARIPDDDWSATPVDRLARMCRHHEVPLGLATDGRFWTLVYAPVGATTATATFDAIGWPEAAERTVLRAFVSLLRRARFFAAARGTTLAELFERSKDQGEELTEALGVQVRQAVELLVAALGRADLRERELGRTGLQRPATGTDELEDVDAHEVYRAAVAVMMRIVFLLFAEERHLLPADNDLYASAYSASQLRAELETRANEGSEEELEHSTAAWHRLRALFRAVHDGIDHPRLTIHPHKGSLFDPKEYDWLPPSIDDRTVLHMLRSVQRVEVGTGKSRETRTVSFRALDVEQIGYVYEGLLSFEGFRASELVVGLIGKAGVEDEVALSDLEAIAATAGDIEAWAAALAEKYKSSGIGSPRKLASLLKPMSESDRVEARKKLLAVTGGVASLAERLLPVYGIIRQDLRDLPVVILPGALYVTESTLRASTGTHYTPKELAEEVVLHALQPLVYSPGPRETADAKQWVPLRAAEILDLKVADIAMGSAAFLVAAARYLAEHLVGAWVRERDERVRDYSPPSGERSRDADVDPVVVEARRKIIGRCLYGVDINPMAVEMAKLSLWLVSMDAGRSFAFLDDRMKCGDSLLGLTSLEQLESVHLSPREGRRLNTDLLDWTSRVRPALDAATRLRQQISEVEDSWGDAPERKEGLLGEAESLTADLHLIGDLVVGAALAGSVPGAGYRDPSSSEPNGEEKRGRSERYWARAAELTNSVTSRHAGVEARLQARKWLAVHQQLGALDRNPVHWPLAFPEVFERGGFDAVIGNPPFLGGTKITGHMGVAYREYLVEWIAQGVRAGGRSDLVAYFVLRAHQLLTSAGQAGLIATKTLAETDTREVGLDQIVGGGSTIRAAVRSRPWPAKSAALEYCAIWTNKGRLGLEAGRFLDGERVEGITTSLEAGKGVTRTPHRLMDARGLCFEGVKVTGMGFILDEAEARALIDADARNSDVVFPYLTGDDINSRCDCSPSRWVINFHDWPEGVAASYEQPFSVIEKRVRPERQRTTADGKYVLRSPLPQRYWQYGDKRPTLKRSLSGLARAVVLTKHTKILMPVMASTGQVFSHSLAVFASDDPALLAVLSSSPHVLWSLKYASSLGVSVRYAASDTFETLVLPPFTNAMRDLGGRLDRSRQEVMLRGKLGLTSLYNGVYDAAVKDRDVVMVREIHRLMDEEVVRAYGWDDLLAQGLDHGFHAAGRETRYTVGPAIQTQILDRLLDLNHERYAAEVAAGLHTKGGKGRAGARPLDTTAALEETKTEEHLI